MRVERRLMQELPEDESGIAQWCKDVFVVKVEFDSMTPSLLIVESDTNKINFLQKTMSS